MDTVSPKLIFFDLDGTLINKDGVVSESTRCAIERVKNRGTKIAFASGRPTFAALDLMQMLGVDAPSAFYSSAVIYDPIKKRTIHQWAIDRSDLKELVAKAKAYDLYAEAYTEQGYFIEQTTQLTEMHYEYMKIYPEVGSLESVVQEREILKFVVISQTPKEEKRMREFMGHFAHLHFGVATGAAHPWIRFCNITNPNSSRTVVFNSIAKLLGVGHSEIMAFGDGESDMTFLSLAGCGVAMGNAPDIVKSSAKHVTLSVEDNGVAHALSALVFGECAL